MKKSTGVITSTLVAVLVTGCAGPQKLSASSSLPAAQGSLLCEEASNGNTSIDLKVKHLASPDRLTPPAGVYVVWTKINKDASPQNIGALEVSSDLSGRLRTVTSLREFELFVTGEATGQAPTPSGEPLLWANCNR